MKRSIKIIIVGASGFGREVLWTLRDCNKKNKKYEIIGFIDDKKSLHGKVIDDLMVLGGIEWFSEQPRKDITCVVAIGDSEIRYKTAKKLEKIGVKFSTIIHPSVITSKYVSIGNGTIIQAGCILTTGIKLGNHVHVNINSTIGHDVSINDFVTINPGVCVNGNTLIETGSYVGAGTVMKQGIKIGKWSIIGAGTVLIDDVSDHSVFVGVPGKLKKKL